MTSSETGGRKAATLIRTLVIANFLLMLILIGPASSHNLDLTLRSLGVQELIGRTLQLWLAGSTLLLTGLFIRIVWKNRRIAEVDLPKQRFRIEGMLVIAWWVTILVIMAYGFMLGMGG